jgi:hypothetical protein
MKHIRYCVHSYMLAWWCTDGDLADNPRKKGQPWCISMILDKVYFVIRTSCCARANSVVYKHDSGQSVFCNTYLLLCACQFLFATWLACSCGVPVVCRRGERKVSVLVRKSGQMTFICTLQLITSPKNIPKYLLM